MMNSKLKTEIIIFWEANKRKVPALRQRSLRETGSTARKVIVARPTLKSNFELSNFQ